MTPINRGDESPGWKPVVSVIALMALALPIKIVMFAIAMVVIVVGFELVLAGAGFVVLFAVLGAFISLPFVFVKWAWDERGTPRERSIRWYSEMWRLTPEEAEVAYEREKSGQSALTLKQRYDKDMLTPSEKARLKDHRETIRIYPGLRGGIWAEMEDAE
jgi:hypothetical protein